MANAPIIDLYIPIILINNIIVINKKNIALYCKTSFLLKVFVHRWIASLSAHNDELVGHNDRLYISVYTSSESEDR